MALIRLTGSDIDGQSCGQHWVNFPEGVPFQIGIETPGITSVDFALGVSDSARQHFKETPDEIVAKIQDAERPLRESLRALEESMIRAAKASAPAFTIG